LVDQEFTIRKKNLPQAKQNLQNHVNPLLYEASAWYNKDKTESAKCFLKSKATKQATIYN